MICSLMAMSARLVGQATQIMASMSTNAARSIGVPRRSVGVVSGRPNNVVRGDEMVTRGCWDRMVRSPLTEGNDATWHHRAGIDCGSYGRRHPGADRTRAHGCRA